MEAARDSPGPSPSPAGGAVALASAPDRAPVKGLRPDAVKASSDGSVSKPPAESVARVRADPFNAAAAAGGSSTPPGCCCGG